jgi:hypothetical protein
VAASNTTSQNRKKRSHFDFLLEDHNMGSEQIKAEIAAIEKALGRVNEDFDRALRQVTEQGVGGIVTVLDSHGQRVEKPGINPACRVLSAARQLRRQLEEQLGSLRAELRRIERTATTR